MSENLPPGMLDSRDLVKNIWALEMPEARRAIQKDRNAWGRAIMVALRKRLSADPSHAAAIIVIDSMMAECEPR